MKTVLRASACALALCAASPAFADISSDLSLDDMNLQGPSWAENHIRVTGDVAVPLGWNNISLQGSGQYEFISGDNFDFSAGTFGLTPFWTGSDARVAVSIQRTQVLDFSAWNSGVGAEFFLAPDLTVAAKGGVWWGSENGKSGGYVGGQATYYWTPDLALSATVDYSTNPDSYDTAYKARAEYRIVDNLSIYGGYTFDDTSHTPVHLLTIGLKLYCNGNGATTLVDEQRSGTVGWISTWDPLWFHD